MVEVALRISRAVRPGERKIICSHRLIVEKICLMRLLSLQLPKISVTHRPCPSGGPAPVSVSASFPYSIVEALLPEAFLVAGETFTVAAQSLWPHRRNPPPNSGLTLEYARPPAGLRKTQP